MSSDVDYKQELERAYRALFAYAKATATGKAPSETSLKYHALTIAAAVRFVEDCALDGSSYFDGKDVSVLLESLQRLRS